MEWDNKTTNSPSIFRLVGLLLLGVGLIMLVASVFFIFAGSVLATVFLICSIFVNTAAVILLRKKS